MTIVQKLNTTLQKESKKFASTGKLQGIYEKFEKMGINTKTTYTLPLKDTIGKRMHELLHGKSSL